jgi:hypothetical protein
MMKIAAWPLARRFGKPSVRVAALLAAAFGLSACVSPGEPRPDPAETVRPRIAQVVDADTGQPVQGAIVLIVFYLWPERGFGNFPVSKVFRDSREAFTDQDGRFAVDGPFDSRSSGTERVHIFKPGYGPWRFRGQEGAPKNPLRAPNPLQAIREHEAWVRQSWERFTTTGVVIELRPLRTREERLKYAELTWDLTDEVRASFSRWTLFDPGGYFFDVPNDRLANFQVLVDQERASLGLPPRPLSGNRQPR